MVELSDFDADELARVMAERHPGVEYRVLARTDIANSGWECDYAAVAVSLKGLGPEIIVLGAVDTVGKDLAAVLREKTDEYRQLVETTEALLRKFALAQFGLQTDELAAQFPDPPADLRGRPREIVGGRLVRREGESDEDYAAALERHLQTIRLGHATRLRIAMERAVSSIEVGDDVNLLSLSSVADGLRTILEENRYGAAEAIQQLRDESIAALVADSFQPEHFAAKG